MSRPRTSWDPDLTRSKSPLGDLAKQNPKIRVTKKIREEAERDLERQVAPYRRGIQLSKKPRPR